MDNAVEKDLFDFLTFFTLDYSSPNCFRRNTAEHGDFSGGRELRWEFSKQRNWNCQRSFVGWIFQSEQCPGRNLVTTSFLNWTQTQGLLPCEFNARCLNSRRSPWMVSLCLIYYKSRYFIFCVISSEQARNATRPESISLGPRAKNSAILNVKNIFLILTKLHLHNNNNNNGFYSHETIINAYTGNINR